MVLKSALLARVDERVGNSRQFQVPSTTPSAMADTQPRLELVDKSARDPNFYAEDGNIILAAKDSENRTIYFRLHRSILVKHSPVFADMFSMPPPPTAEKYDGVPLVEMPDDADGLRTLIALLYDPQCISVILKSEDFAARMFDPAVLARKYQVDWIREMVASHLEQQWPRTLIDWDTMADAELGYFFTGIPHANLKVHRLPEPVTAIRLARECDVPAVIPIAFLHLLRQPLEIDPDDAGDMHTSVWETPERALLAPADLHRLALARQRMGKWFKLHTEAWELEPCFSDMPCETRWLRILATVAIGVARDGNVLGASQRVFQGGMKDICTPCSLWCRDEIGEMREEFFDKLPTFFQL
ncbi:hypothetical protein B0H17DRAFT_1150396 [Mycena rosella]|uniref:BTB domain-containing protein n=1 Tax=Mycena rosella TaxID=1033263 RepID=A0AAD7BSQ2_MYCRO|nr:hypothetical protein B0H17DRAFT_1150396 [Mycena rosella]